MEWNPQYETRSQAEQSGTDPVSRMKTLQIAVREANKAGQYTPVSSHTVEEVDTRDKGVRLAYLAQAIRNDIDWKISGGKGVEVIVVVAEVFDRDNWRFVVGINANDVLYDTKDACEECVPLQICGFPVDVVSDNPELWEDLKEIEQKRECERGQPLPESTTVWSWHSEQKVIRHVKNNFGIEGRATLEALGVSHVRGPCSPHTAGTGTNYCEEYLFRKHLKATSHRGIPQFNVATYWYPKHSRPYWKLCNLAYLEQRGVKMQMRASPFDQ